MRMQAKKSHFPNSCNFLQCGLLALPSSFCNLRSPDAIRGLQKPGTLKCVLQFLHSTLLRGHFNYNYNASNRCPGSRVAKLTIYDRQRPSNRYTPSILTILPDNFVKHETQCQNFLFIYTLCKSLSVIKMTIKL